MIVVDTREPKKYYTFVKKIANDKVKRKKLDEGDYMSDRVLVERKTMTDLYNSIIGGRLDSQMKRFTTHTDKHLLLLLNDNMKDFADKMHKINVNPKVDIMYGYIASLSCREGIDVMWIEDVCDSLVSMVKYMKKVDVGEWRVPNRVDEDNLCAKLLGVNCKQYNELKSICGDSLNSIINAEIEELTKVKGIGKVKAKRIKAI